MNFGSTCLSEVIFATITGCVWVLRIQNNHDQLWRCTESC